MRISSSARSSIDLGLLLVRFSARKRVQQEAATLRAPEQQVCLSFMCKPAACALVRLCVCVCCAFKFTSGGGKSERQLCFRRASNPLASAARRAGADQQVLCAPHSGAPVARSIWRAHKSASRRALRAPEEIKLPIECASARQLAQSGGREQSRAAGAR